MVEMGRKSLLTWGSSSSRSWEAGVGRVVADSEVGRGGDGTGEMVMWRMTESSYLSSEGKDRTESTTRKEKRKRAFSWRAVDDDAT